MQPIESVEELETHYGDAVPAALTKVVRKMTPLYRAWIEASRFVVLSTVGPEGTDGSPRGDDGPVVQIADEQTLLLPDWRGNNRIDTLRNIVRDGRVSCMFMVPGSDIVVRVNGRAIVTADADLRRRLAKGDRQPATVIVITLGEMYTQCAKALMRADLWGGARPSVPTAGAFRREIQSDFDAESHDAGYAEYARGRMW